MCITAPAVRVAVGEELGLGPGAVTTGQMVEAQRWVGRGECSALEGYMHAKSGGGAASPILLQPACTS